MPLILVNTTKELSEKEKEEIVSELGKVITYIPGKTESVLMINFLYNQDIYFGGKKLINGAHIDVKCFHNAPFEDNNKFTEAVYELMYNKVEVAKDQMYVTINEMPVWGAKGRLKN